MPLHFSRSRKRRFDYCLDFSRTDRSAFSHPPFRRATADHLRHHPPRTSPAVELQRVRSFARSVSFTRSITTSRCLRRSECTMFRARSISSSTAAGESESGKLDRRDGTRRGFCHSPSGLGAGGKILGPATLGGIGRPFPDTGTDAASSPEANRAMEQEHIAANQRPRATSDPSISPDKLDLLSLAALLPAGPAARHRSIPPRCISPPRSARRRWHFSVRPIPFTGVRALHRPSILRAGYPAPVTEFPAQTATGVR